MAASRRKAPAQEESFLPGEKPKRPPGQKPNLTIRDLKAKKGRLMPEFQSETIDLLVADLHVYRVSMYGDEDGLPKDHYWTWRLCRFMGGKFPTAAEAKWDAVRELAPRFVAAAHVLHPLYEKRHGELSEYPGPREG